MHVLGMDRCCFRSFFSALSILASYPGNPPANGRGVSVWLSTCIADAAGEVE